MAPAPSLKRKNDPQSIARPAKRFKTVNARTILTQASDKALNKNGNLDVAAFVKAREFEIKAMRSSMGASKTALSTRAFQQVPQSMRRRTASHNVKRVPKRLQARAAREVGSDGLFIRGPVPKAKMKDDNTPVVTSRRRKPTPHQRLRLEKAKQLKKRGTLTKKQRARKKEKAGETATEKAEPIKATAAPSGLPKLKKDVLSRPAKPPSKFRKRQIHKSWLPTHIYHAKRAQMTEPKHPLWRFAIPLTPTEKCFRTSHRASSLRGCLAWDMSYMSTIGLEGAEASLLNLLRSIGVEETLLTGKKEAKWRRGTRSWEGWLRERDGEERWMVPVKIVWSVDDDAIENVGEEVQGKRKGKRKLFLRVHPSSFLQIWNEVLKVAKIQRPQVAVEDLRFEIGSIEVVGPASTEALIGALKPTPTFREAVKPQSEITQSTTDPSTQPDVQEDWVDMETPDKIWPQLAGVTNPASLPANAILGFNITDPRLHHPRRTLKSEVSNETLLNLMCSWPPNQTQAAADFFSRKARLTASRLLSSQKAINRRKADALPGAYPDPLPKDPQIPVLLLASRNADRNSQGSWTVLLPWDCVLPVWYSLMHYPLSTGGNPRFGGLQEKMQIAFEQGEPWFPGNYPGTSAGWAWEMLERERAKAEWEKRPKGKRCEWGSVDLGDGKKGEIGLGWACDWERLFQGPPATETTSNDTTTTSTGPSQAALVETTAQADNNITAPKEPPRADNNVTTPKEAPPRPPPPPPLNIYHLPNPLKTSIPAASHALSSIHLTLLTTGHPTRCARIYRLPTTNSSLLTAWQTLASAALSKPTLRSKNNNKTEPKTKRAPSIPPAPAPTAAPLLHERLQTTLTSLLHAPTKTRLPGEVPKAGDADYPRVPDEVDLVGFVTTANYQLGAGQCEAFGGVAVGRLLDCEVEGEGKGKGERRGAMGMGMGMGKGKERERLVVVRNAGQSLGRLARWRFV